MIVKYYKNGKSHICDVSDINEYGESGYQWRNILAVVADCVECFPKTRHINEEIDHSNEMLEEVEESEDVEHWERVLNILTKLKEQGREWAVFLHESDEELYAQEETWFYAEDEEDACRRFILENHWCCDVEFIEGVGRLNAGKPSKIVRWWDENGDERFADIEAEGGQWRNILSMVARRGYLLPEVKENEYGKWVVWFEDDPDFEVLEAEDGEDAFKKCVEKGMFGNYKIEFIED